MILKTLYLKIGEPGLSVDYIYAFKLKNRFICNWLEREVLKKIRFNATEFDRIVVSVCSRPKTDVFVNTSKVACVEIDLDRNQIDAAKGDDLAKLQIKLLKIGIEKCALSHSIPKTELFQGLDLFVEQGMKNEWLQKKRTFRDFGLVATLNCKMTQDVFSLRLIVQCRNTIVFGGIILETEPDEIVFERKYKDVEIKDGKLIVTGKISRPLWRKPLSELKR